MPSSRLPPPHVGRRRRRQRRLLLITGTPGSGKRQLGAYLELERDFVHVDLDSRSLRAELLRGGVDDFRRDVAALVGEHAKVVVTWSFTEETQLPYVEALRALGFEWLWTDPDRGAAYDGFVARGSSVRPPRFVEAFEPDGGFVALESVLHEIRRRRPQLPRPRAVRVPALPSPQRPAWAGVAAFAAAGLAAVCAYAAGVFTPAQPARVAVGHRTAAHRPAGVLPVDAVFVPGKSLGGIALGDTPQQVRAAWGRRYTVCQGCAPRTWFFLAPTGDHGAGVSFRRGHVTAVFTLGSPQGWHTTSGLRVGELLRRFNDPAGTTTACSGYGAISTRTANAVTSILTIGQSVYGFALTRPSEPVCR